MSAKKQRLYEPMKAEAKAGANLRIKVLNCFLALGVWLIIVSQAWSGAVVWKQERFYCVLV